jgi:hypothetical protein
VLFASPAARQTSTQPNIRAARLIRAGLS